MKVTKVILLFAALFSRVLNAAEYSGDVFLDVSVEFQRTQIPIAVNIKPNKITQGIQPEGTKIADINVSTRNASEHRLAVRFSESNEFQKTSVYGTSAMLRGLNEANQIPLKISDSSVDEIEIQGVKMMVSKTPVTSYNFPVVMAYSSEVFADTYTIYVEGAIYNP